MSIVNIESLGTAKENPSMVFRYSLPSLNSLCSIKLPTSAKLLSVGFDLKGRLSLWAEVVSKEQEQEEERLFLLVGAGVVYELPKGGYTKFLGTVHHDMYIDHIFEVLCES